MRRRMTGMRKRLALGAALGAIGVSGAVVPGPEAAPGPVPFHGAPVGTAAVPGPGAVHGVRSGIPAAPGAVPLTAAADTHRVYVANESSDLVSRVAFVPGAGAWVEAEIPVGLNPGDIDGAHGITVSPDGAYWYLSIAHGTPFGQVWQFHAGPDTLVAMTELGLFPATMGLSPDGRFLLAVNFNLHGDPVPSTVSVVYTPEMREVAKVETCVMPHGSRLSADGGTHYSTCMHSDQLVAIDVGSLTVTERFLLSRGHETLLATGMDTGPVEHGPSAAGNGARDGGGDGPDGSEVRSHTPMTPSGVERCSPTWVEPGQGHRADRFAYVACNRLGQVLELDVESWRVTRRFTTGSGPYNLDVSADGRLLLATLKGGQAVALVNLDGDGGIRRLATSRPVTHGVVVEPGGRFAFVSNESVGSVPGTLDVFDLETLERVATVELAYQSGGIDYWGGRP